MRTALSAAIVGLLLSSEPALADSAPAREPNAPVVVADTPDSAAIAEAKQRFLNGLDLVNARQWDAALAEFSASYDVFPTRAALSNRAVCLAHLARWVEAREAYETLSQRFGAELSGPERAQIDAQARDLAQNIGSIAITTSVAGATVVIDGQQRGTTPLAESIDVDAGTHSVRVVKDGYSPFETAIVIAGHQTKAVTATLSAARPAGTLSVREASGRTLDVLIDGARVGTTPWDGPVAPGVHSVSLQGPGELGAPPSSATVAQGQTRVLTLVATTLDAEARVEPWPANASVFIDGVPVGAGVWQGRLASGEHVIEAFANGYRPARLISVLTSRRRTSVRARLERDPRLFAAAFVPHPYVEVTGGLALGGGLGGDADSACETRVADLTGALRDGCSARSRPFGGFGAARAGYALAPRLGVEIALGYIGIEEKQTRRVQVSRGATRSPFYSDDYRDHTALSGPFAALSASYHFFEHTPFVVRIWAGALRAHVETSNRGTYATNETNEVRVAAIPEDDQDTFVPFVGPELRLGYRLTSRISADLGLAVLLFMAPALPRTGDVPNVAKQSGRRATPVRGYQEGATYHELGFVELPRENALGTFVSFLPSVGLRLDL